MKFNRRRLISAACGAPLCAVAAPFVRAQTAYPSAGPIRMLIPFAAGGSTDILARIIADVLSRRIGQNIIADNRPGAGGNIAMGAAARANADGYTILFTSSVWSSIRCSTRACRTIRERISCRSRCSPPRRT